MTSNLVQKKNCFVVGPIGDDDSDDRIHADWLLEDIIEPLFHEHFQDFDVRRADKISNPGQITSQVITALLEAELVIADLTTLNPNAFYEIGIRHTIQKPIIHMHLEGQRIPFDIAPFRSIKFSRRRPSDIRAARGLLHAAVTEAIKPDHQIDNPVTFSRGKLDFEQTATPKEKIIEEALNSMTRRLSALEEDSLLGLDMFRRTRHHYFKKPPRGVHKIVMTVTSRNSVNNREFVEEVARWAGISFESFGIETSDDLLHQVSVIIDESDENQIKAEQFVQDYRGDGYEIRLHNSGPTDNFS
ncbi:hypothetical protein GFL49_34860 [Rhizobium leguminosarum bv. viciae]|nr:hypothetical protein [Rhizobium leguminosarum bv. viciae]